MASTYRPSADTTTSLDADAVRATYRQLGGKGIERAYGWTAAVAGIVRDAKARPDG